MAIQHGPDRNRTPWMIHQFHTSSSFPMVPSSLTKPFPAADHLNHRPVSDSASRTSTVAALTHATKKRNLAGAGEPQQSASVLASNQPNQVPSTKRCEHSGYPFTNIRLAVISFINPKATVKKHALVLPEMAQAFCRRREGSMLAPLKGSSFSTAVGRLWLGLHRGAALETREGEL